MLYNYRLSEEAESAFITPIFGMKGKKKVWEMNF